MLHATIRNIILPLAIIIPLTGCEESSPIELSANPAAVSINGSTTPEWSSTDITDRVASGVWSGSNEASGTEVIGEIQTDSTFVLSCTNTEDGQAVSTSVSVKVETTTPTRVSLLASPRSVSFNGSTTLSWGSNADSCSASGSWTGREALTSLTENSTYKLSCTGSGGTAEDAVVGIVEVVPTPTPTPVSVNLTAATSIVATDGSITLSWQSSNADSCTASGDWSGSQEATGTEAISALT